MIGEGLQIQRQDVVAGPLVKSLSYLIAQPSTFEHSLNELRDVKELALLVEGQIAVGVFHNLDQGVEPDHVEGAEGRRLGPAQQWPRESIHFLDAQTMLLHSL